MSLRLGTIILTPETKDVDISIPSSGWSGSSGQWTQSVTVQGVTAESINFITPRVNATSTDRTNFMAAMLYDAGQSQNKINLVSAAEEKPADLLCRVTILKVATA